MQFARALHTCGIWWRCGQTERHGGARCFQPWVSWWDATERTDTPFTTSQPPATVDRPELTHVFCKIRKTHPVSIQMFLSRLLIFFLQNPNKTGINSFPISFYLKKQPARCCHWINDHLRINPSRCYPKTSFIPSQISHFWFRVRARLATWPSSMVMGAIGLPVGWRDHCTGACCGPIRSWATCRDCPPGCCG